MSGHYFPAQGGGGGGGGTITGGSNVGTGSQVFKTVTGTNLVFRTLVDTGTIAFTQNVNDITAAFVGNTDDVPEGATNLYFTDERVDDAVAGLIQNSNNIQWTYNDGADTLTGLAQIAQTNAFIWSNTTGELADLSGWAVLTTGDIVNSSQVSLNFAADGTSTGQTAHNWNLNIEPTANAPTGVFTVHNISANLDNLANGFNFGTGGQCGQVLNVGFNFNGNGSTYGSVAYLQMNSTVGNGTDPVTLQGLSYVNGFANVAANVTLENGLQGYGFQPNINASAISGTNFYGNAFYDFAQINIPINGYQSIQLSPTLDEIANNSGFTGVNINPTVNNFAGNANATAIAIAGTYSNFTTGGFTGLNINPNIPNLLNFAQGINISGASAAGTSDWTAINVNLGTITTTGAKRGLSISGGTALIDKAIEAGGRCDLTNNFDLQSSLTQQYGHIIGGQINVPDGTAITGTDVLANNMAFTVDLGDATSTYTGGLVSMTTLGFVGQIQGDGALTGGINFCLAGYNPVHTGSIDRVNNFSSLALPPSGGGSIDEAVLFFGDMPFGLAGTDSWGLRVEDSTGGGVENYVTRLLVGTAAARKVTNASCGIELNSTTQAVKTSTMTTTQKNALTAVDGMWVYDSTLNQHQFRENGSWVGLGGGPTAIAPTSISSISTNTSAASGVLYLVDTSGGAVTVTLPAPAANAIVVVKDIGNATTNNIDVAPNGAENIDGANTNYVIDADFMSVQFVSDGTDWHVL